MKGCKVRRFTAEEDAVIIAMADDYSFREIGETIGRGLGSVSGRLKRLEVVPDPIKVAERIKRNGTNLLEIGKQYRFTRGHKPFNTGVKGYKNPGCEKGWFPKGNKPVNWRPIGSIRTTREGRVQVKIQDGHGNRNWKFEHYIVWEAANGLVPAKHVIRHIDGNPANNDINNLEMISMKENYKKNSPHQFPVEIKELIYTRISLVRQINRRKRLLNNKLNS